MKKISFKKAVAAVAAMSLIACTSAMTAAASSAGATIEIENKTLTVDEAAALNYKVPLFVTLTENAGLTALEFGVEVSDNLAYNIYAKNKDAKTVLKSTGIVLLCVAVLGIIIWLIDTGLSEVVKLLVNAAKNASSDAETTTEAAAAVAGAIHGFLGF